MKKIELKILGLSKNYVSNDSYILLLSEKGGNMKLPVIIKSNDAHNIAIEIENINQSRPQLKDIMRNINDTYGIDIVEVKIIKVLEGIFYSTILVDNGVDSNEIECTLCDGALLSIMYKCPIYTTQEVIDLAGVEINDDGTPINNDSVPNVSVNDLEELLKNAIEREDYEVAASLRDRIEQHKQ